ncbi:hypothetical protein DM02DRAFT_638792 [Periconia macrospinosa]|uniref:Uncharacterized protein n=1 Tax=Periconia macrospinosa TaxID=97972 RepID=A0A2V1E7B0_9PLEO|nr:hypothetical protein DM02DRAFT_638792 [Periconia macrospinosa]
MAEKTITSSTPASLTPPFTARSIPPTRSGTSQSPSAVDATQQPVLENAANIPLTPLESLPTIAGSQDEIFLTNDDVDEFLKWDLNLKRLNRIHGHLWMAGRPMRARPLHRYKMMGFEILQTQQMDLHLLKFSNRLIIKPLAEYMLDHAFWTAHMCKDKTFHENGCGFLLSYVWLITTPIDLKLAHELFLLPSFVTWPWWKDFVRDFASHVDLNALDQVNKRFHFGDLRLGRINSIYRIRFASTHFVRGYLYGYNRYVVFFQRKFGWILVVFVFFSLVLAAMQVGASVEPLQSKKEFIASCFGFVVFSMAAVAGILGAVGILFVFIYIYNMMKAIAHNREMKKKRESRANKRK